MELNQYLQTMAERSASDLFLSPGAPPNIKIEGVTQRIGEQSLTAADVRAMAYSVMTDRQQSEFEERWEMNLAFALGSIGRFRINVYKQRGDVTLAVRYVTNKIPTIEELNLPPLLKELIMLPRGLILFVGAAGSGKSSTMAAMIDYRNRNRTGHILTVEDPIEFMHSHIQSVVDQREVGLDTHSFADALRNAMREAPEVIMIGEIRDRETMQHAISYAETGHLCLSTLHANNANQTLDRIINFFPDTARAQILLDMSLNLKAVVSQRLIPSVREGVGRVPAVEILLSTAYVSDLIAKGDISELKEAMKSSTEVGMQTFDESLYRLYASGQISYRDAIDVADSRTDLALRVRLQGPAPKRSQLSEDFDQIHLQPPIASAREGRIGG